MRAILGKLNGEWLTDLAKGAAPFCATVDAAVAYVCAPNPLVDACKEHGMRLTLYGLLDADVAVHPKVLKELLSWGPTRAEARLVKGNFHAKVIWWRGYGAYVGSANLTEKAWYNNVEAGIFFSETELTETGMGAELELMFDYLHNNSISVTDEIVGNLSTLAGERRKIDALQRDLRKDFDQLFGHLQEHKGLVTVAPKGQRENRAEKRFVTEWMETLQLMRGLRRDFTNLNLRPPWVDANAHPALHFDQFLHAYYYDFVRGDGAVDEDEDATALDKVQAHFIKNRGNTATALTQAARWWASLPNDCHGEEVFIRDVAPRMQKLLSREALHSMGVGEFTEAIRNVNAFRMHARQIPKSEFGLPSDHHENIEECVNRLCEWLWRQRSKSGKTVRDVLEFVLWGSAPVDMERRLWLGVWGDDYRLPHFGQSSLGEAVGWARPDDYPPRNNRTNKALRALGHDVKLFSKNG